MTLDLSSRTSKQEVRPDFLWLAALGMQSNAIFILHHPVGNGSRFSPHNAKRCNFATLHSQSSSWSEKVRFPAGHTRLEAPSVRTLKLRFNIKHFFTFCATRCQHSCYRENTKNLVIGMLTVFERSSDMKKQNWRPHYNGTVMLLGVRCGR